MKHVHLSMRDLSLIIINQSQLGKSRDEIARYLRTRGWPEASARHFIDNVLAERSRSVAQVEAQPDGQRLSASIRAVVWIAAVLAISVVAVNLLVNLPLF